MQMRELLRPAPEFKLSESLIQEVLSDNVLFIGCISYEDRCLSALKRIRYSCGESRIIWNLISIEDDECTFLPWKIGCATKTNENYHKMQGYVGSSTFYSQYKMSTRTEDILRLLHQITSILETSFGEVDGVRCVFDSTCFPSFFAFQILKELMSNVRFKDVVVLYTKPEDYTKGELKFSPRDTSRSSFLPLYGQPDFTKGKWIVGIGFDYDSLKNASLIRESLRIENIDVIVPFPGYQHEFFMRSIMQNSEILDNTDNTYHYSPADSPFKTYYLLDKLIDHDSNCILSSFGPKPICLGFAMAAIKNNLPILHVQATNYNPEFSSGEKETFFYLLRSKGISFFDVEC